MFWDTNADANAHTWLLLLRLPSPTLKQLHSFQRQKSLPFRLNALWICNMYTKYKAGVKAEKDTLFSSAIKVV